MRSYSVVMATYNKAWALPVVLNSILRQMTADGEIIVVDDGSTDNTPEVCSCFDVRYTRLTEAVGIHRNPSVARNVGYKLAKGDIVIAQSDEVLHIDETIKPLVEDLRVGEFQSASVWDLHIDSISNIAKGKIGRQRTGLPDNPPYFYLGSLWRKDIYAVGGNDEDFKMVAGEDDWFDHCLRQGLGLRPVKRGDIAGYHLVHDDWPETGNIRGKAGHEVLNNKIAEGVYVASGGPWKYK